MMAEWEDRYHVHARVAIVDAKSVGDDIVIAMGNQQIHIPMLRQQVKQDGLPCFLCLSDFVSPHSDTIGVFATAVDSCMEHLYADDYKSLLAQTVCDRLAEAAAEFLHREVRRTLWGYCKDETLSIEDMLLNRFQGIRPAVGYPSLPDMSLNFLLNDIIKMDEIGIRLTGSGAMIPHASVSGLMLSHPQSAYFNVGPIGEDQLIDYARRRGRDVAEIQRFIK